MVGYHLTAHREDICLQTSLLLFKCANHKNKRPFITTASEALIGTLMTIVDVNDIIAIVQNFVTVFETNCSTDFVEYLRPVT